jgi:hypothetical protein
MARNTEPIFVDEPFITVVTVGDESVLRDPSSTGGMQKIVAAGSNGALIESLYAVALGNNALTVLRFYLVPLGGLPALCLPEVVLPLINNASSNNALVIQNVELPRAVIGDVGTRALRLPPSGELWCGLSNTVASGYNIVAMGGFY